jgi:hypothetical protein
MPPARRAEAHVDCLAANVMLPRDKPVASFKTNAGWFVAADMKLHRASRWYLAVFTHPLKPPGYYLAPPTGL